MHFDSSDNSESDDKKRVTKKHKLKEQHSLDYILDKNTEKTSCHTCCFDKWAELSDDCQVDERVEHYKRLLEETEHRIQTRDDMIVTLQNQLKKIENICRKGFENTEHYRFKYCVVAKELENMKKICSQYKDSIDKLIKINSELVSKAEFRQLQKEAQSYKTQYEELSKAAALREATFTEYTQADLDTPNIQQDLNLLKQQCHGIEDLLQNQNYTIDKLVAQWLKEFENVYKHNAESTTYTEGALNVISTETAMQNKNLQEILTENRAIKVEVLNLKQQILEMSKLEINGDDFKCDCTCKRDSVSKNVQTDDGKDNTGSLIEQIEHLKKASSRTNEFNEVTIKTLQQSLGSIENEKGKITEKYEEIYKRNRLVTAELENKTVQLKAATEDMNKLKNKVYELQELIDTKNKEKNEAIVRSVEYDEMQQLLQQYKEQVDFKKLENEKLRKKDLEQQVQLQNYEYDTEQNRRESMGEINKLKFALEQLQNKYDELLKEYKETQLRLTEENSKAISAIELKDTEIKNLKSEACILHDNLTRKESEVNRLEGQNDKSLTEISFLYKHKESEWYEISHKYKEREDYIEHLESQRAQLEEELRQLKHNMKLNSDNKNEDLSFHNSKAELLTLLHTLEERLINAIKDDDLQVPSMAIDEFLFHTKQFIAILEQRKHIDVRTKISYSENSLYDDKKGFIRRQTGYRSETMTTTETQSDNVSDMETLISNIELDTNLRESMKLVLNGLEQIKQQIGERTQPEYDEVSKVDDISIRTKGTLVSESFEKNLETIEEELENQLHEDDAYGYLYDKTLVLDEPPSDNKENANPEDVIDVTASRSYTIEYPCDTSKQFQVRIPKDMARTEEMTVNCPCAWCVQQKLHPRNSINQRPASRRCNDSNCPKLRKNYQ